MNNYYDASTYYATTDLGLASALCLWQPIDRIDRTDPRKASFFFERNDDLLRLVDLYRRAELQVEPQAYFNQLKAVKTRLYEREGP